MNKLNISVKDQFGVHYAIEATLDEVVSSTVKTYDQAFHLSSILVVFRKMINRPFKRSFMI